MNAKQVEAFRLVVLTGSMTAAAADLRTSQPSISRLIAQLERSTRLKLFERQGGRLVPTEEGLAFYRDVERAFVGLTTLVESAERIRNVGTARLRIAAVPTVALGYLPRVIQRFRREHPQVTFSLQTGNSSEVAHWTASQLCDIGILVNPADPRGIDVEALYEADGVCVMPKRHRLAARKRIDARDLEGEPFISFAYPDINQARTDRVFEKAEVTRDVVLETPSSTVICALVALGMGVSIVSPMVARNYIAAGLVARPFAPAIPFANYMVFPQHRPRGVLVAGFAKALREVVAAGG